MDDFIVTSLALSCFSATWIHLIYNNSPVIIFTVTTGQAISGPLVILNSKIPYEIHLYSSPLLYSYFCVFLCFAWIFSPVL